MQENKLRSLGIFRIPIPIPFVEAGGPVNAYLVEEEDGVLLFDAGLGTEPARAALAEGFARAGRRFEEVNRIVLSHGHIDHFGSAAWIQEQAGRAIPVFIHPADADKVLKSGMEWPALLRQNSRYLSMLGVPMPVLEEAAAVLSVNPNFGKRLAETFPLQPGDRFPCRHVSLEVLHMPGHTPGLCCLYASEHRLLFSGDHFLERVSPNPLMDLRPDGTPSHFKPLLSYFQSLDRLRTLDISLVLPGHAAPFTGHLPVIDSLASFYSRRREKLLKGFERGPLTVYQAMKTLFSNPSGFALILMLSETLGNLEVLEDRGEVRREMYGEQMRFRLAG
jgi:glyoxylase-like metal-dependent hydrolase (beta-lactamase superfamily II)